MSNEKPDPKDDPKNDGKVLFGKHTPPNPELVKKAPHEHVYEGSPRKCRVCGEPEPTAGSLG